MLDLTNVWPEWKAVEKVGEGSYGKVYRCVREEFGIQSVCAIKSISLPQNDGGVEFMRFEGMSEEASRAYLDELIKDFTNEIKVMEMLKGAPNVVSVENYKIVKRTASLGWDIYIRMEFLETFPDYTEKHKMSEKDVLRLGFDICTALEVCAKKGIIHRDIKPDNIFVDEYGKFKLGDFGVARQLERSLNGMSRKGTYSYMAPEVYREENYDGRADIYSLGMVMYKLLNNNRDPFIDPHQPMIKISERSEAINRRRRGERIPPPAFASTGAAALILKACEFNPDDRFMTVTEFKRTINDVMEGNLPIETPARKKISVFEIDTVGEKLFGENSQDNGDDGILVHTPTVHFPKEPSVRSESGSTKIYSSKPSKNFKNLLNIIPKPFEMDEPEDGKKKLLKQDSPNIVSEPIKKIDKPFAAEEKAEAKPIKQEPKPAEPPKPANPPKQPTPIKPSIPVTPPAPTIEKKQPDNSDKALKLKKIVSVLVVAAVLVLIGAVAIPAMVKSKMDSEDEIDTDIDYTEISTEENGDYVVYGYNSDDLLIEENYYDSEDNYEGCTEYIYDEDGEKTGYKVYNENKKLVDSHKY